MMIKVVYSSCILRSGSNQVDTDTYLQRVDMVDDDLSGVVPRMTCISCTTLSSFSATSIVVRPMQFTSTDHTQCRACQSFQRVSPASPRSTDKQDYTISKISVESFQSKCQTHHIFSIADIADYHQEFPIRPTFSFSLETVYENGISDLEIKSACE